MLFFRVYLKNDIGVLFGKSDKTLEPCDLNRIWYCPETGIIIHDTFTHDGSSGKIKFVHRSSYHISKMPGDQTFAIYFFEGTQKPRLFDDVFYDKSTPFSRDVVKLTKSKRGRKKPSGGDTVAVQT